MGDKKEHWEKIYTTKEFKETSWFQKKPVVSLDIIESLGLSREARIIDIGGGDSYLVDNLLDLGYKNLNVLDISEVAIEKAKTRIGEKAGKVIWIVSDAVNYKADKKFDLWHDRAAFHFLTEEKKINTYLDNLKASVKPGGYVILATFSEKGPEKCSGITIKQYSAQDMERLFEKDFEIVRVENIDHTTPWGDKQNFTFGLFRKK